MTSFFHDLEDQLRTAADERTSGGHAPGQPPRPDPPRHRRWRWLAGGARALPVAMAVAVTLAVLVGALVLLGHRGGQSPTPPASGGPASAFATLVEQTPGAQLLHEFALIGAATKKVQASAACHVPPPRVAPQIHAAPGQALLSTLGVLGRPATAADRLPRGAGPIMGPGVSVYAGATRRAARIGGTSYYLVPIRQDLAGGFPSARCFTLQKAALDKAVPTLPAALRTPVREIEAAVIAYVNAQAAKHPTDAVCEVTAQRNGGGFSCSHTTAEIQHGLYPDDDNGVFNGIVPDGVASVTVSFREARDPRFRSVTTAVHGNVYAAPTGYSGALKPGSATVVWRAADGRVLRTYSEPAVASLRQLCRQEPDACVPALALATTVSHSHGVSESSSSSSASATATTRSRPSTRPTTSGG
jgi:hypothetical protein